MTDDQQDSPKYIARSFLAEAKEYFSCFNILRESEYRTNSDQLLISPILFLARHVVELLLKALIIKDWGNNYCIAIPWFSFKFEPHKKTVKEMHSLIQLLECWTNLQSYYLCPTYMPEDINTIQKNIELLDKYDPRSTYFRYPFKKNGAENSRISLIEIDDEDYECMPCTINQAIYGAELSGGSIYRINDVEFLCLEYGLSKTINLLITQCLSLYDE